MKLKIKLIGSWILSAIFFTLAGSFAVAAQNSPVVIVLPGGGQGIGFDDLLYAKELGKVAVPAGRTGKLDLINPVTLEVASISGFAADTSTTGHHGSGITSAAFGHGFLFATNRTDRKLYVVDTSKKEIVSSVALSTSPDYVRYVAPTNEIWVTEPRVHRIEIFSLGSGVVPAPQHAAFIDVGGRGPESLVIDATRQRAYMHIGSTITVAIDLKSHEIVARWPNGCKSGEGLDMDEARGFLIAGCGEGSANVLDVNHDGKVVSSLKSGAGVDIIAYSPELGHVYLPGAESASMALMGLSAVGQLSLLGTVPTAKGAHCVTVDDGGGVWVCDVQNGRILYFKDPYPTSR